MHKEIWEKMLENINKNIFGHELLNYLHDIRNEFITINELINNGRELLSDLRETNDSLLNAKQNQTMQFLTMTAFIFYPLSLIASFFSIPSHSLPVLGNNFDWQIILGIMLIVTIGILAYFKKKKWTE